MKSSASVSRSAERMTRARMDACGNAREIAGSVSAFRPGSSPSSQPGKPPAENQRRLIAKTSTISIANQKFGTATPNWVTPMTVTSAAEPRRDAANMPTGKAIAVDSVSASSASGSEIQSRSPIMSATGVR